MTSRRAYQPPSRASTPTKPVRWVAWDWNGTLLDDVTHSVAVMNALLAEEGLPPLDVARYRQLFDFPVRVYYERLGFDLSGDRWERLARRFIDAYDDGVHACTLRDGARHLLEALSAAGAHSVIVSAARTHSIEALVTRFLARELLREIVGLDDHYAQGKEAVGVAWMQSSGADRDSTLFVGDTQHDFEVARAMGVRCVLVADGHQSRERLESCGCPVVESFADLAPWLLG